MNLEKNKIYTVTCTSFGNDGEGIAKIDGFTLFIAVSYTHLDVYKRQSMFCRKRCGSFFYSSKFRRRKKRQGFKSGKRRKKTGFSICLYGFYNHILFRG